MCMSLVVTTTNLQLNTVSNSITNLNKQFDVNAFNEMFSKQNNMDYCSDNSIENMNMLSNLEDLNNISKITDEKSLFDSKESLFEYLKIENDK